MTRRRCLAALIVLSVFTGTGALAQNAQPPGAALAEQDREFMNGAAEVAKAGVEASREALRKATDPALKAFAQRMLDEHGKADGELQSLARAKGLQLPSEPSIAQKSKLELLRAADGREFDRNFAENFAVDAHRKALELSRNETAQGRDAQVKALAERLAGRLQQQLQVALNVRAQIERSPNGGRGLTGSPRSP